MELLHVGAFSTCVCQPDRHAWFESLTIPGMPQSRCCGGDDCKATEAELREGTWWARAPDGAWLHIPADRVIHGRGNPVGQPVLCAPPNWDSGGYYPICFVPGALS